MNGKKIYVALGFHVNYYHSWRGDRNDDTGFGIDTRIIRKLVNLMDACNDRGLQCCGTWDFDNYWSLESIMPRYAPDVLDAIKRRVNAGIDEVIIDNWNNGIASAFTAGEFRETIKRTITNPQASGVADIFDSYTPLVRPQESMFSQGNIELYLEQGIDAISLYYTAIPFDAFRNFVPRLSPNEMYNPVWLKSTQSDARMKLIPTFTNGDVAANLSLKKWLEKIHRFQTEGKITGDALVYINMDADADIWIGLGLPDFLKVPNTYGINEFAEIIAKCPYAEFTTLREYLATHDPVSEITIRQDTADGSFAGYSSWSEKYVNQRLWRTSERARWFSRIAEHITDNMRTDKKTFVAVDSLIHKNPDSYFENKLRLLSTTHFGMNCPAINEERAQVAFHYATNALDSASRAADAAIASLPDTDVAEPSTLTFRVINHSKYENSPSLVPGIRTPLTFTLPDSFDAPADRLALTSDSGTRVESLDIIEPSIDRPTRAITFIHETNGEPFTDYTLAASTRPRRAPQGPVTCDGKTLANSHVTISAGSSGTLSITVDGKKISPTSFLSIGLTYKSESRTLNRVSNFFDVIGHTAGPRGNTASLKLRSTVTFRHKSLDYTMEGIYNITLSGDLPYFFVDATVKVPDTPRTHGDKSVQSRLKDKFDANWLEIMPLQIHPAATGAPGARLKVWKHNFLGVTDYYELNYGDIDHANASLDSTNNHVTDGWLAISSPSGGLLISSDSLINTSPAYCPIRINESSAKQSVWLNPFGAYTGRQPTQVPDPDCTDTMYDLTLAVGPQHRPTAPSFNGQTVTFSLMFASLDSDSVPAQTAVDADAFSLKPAIAIIMDGKWTLMPPPVIAEETAKIIRDYDLDSCREWTYADFLTHRNSGPDMVVSKPQLPALPPELVVRIARDTIRAMLPTFLKR